MRVYSYYEDTIQNAQNAGKVVSGIPPVFTGKGSVDEKMHFFCDF
jgi:hypothetical protein